MYREIPREVMKEPRLELKGVSMCLPGGMSVLGRGNSKGKGWEVWMSLACAPRFRYSWIQESEGKTG